MSFPIRLAGAATPESPEMPPVAQLSAYVPQLETVMAAGLDSFGVPSTEMRYATLAMLQGLAERAERWLQLELLAYPFFVSVKLRGRSEQPEVIEAFFSLLDGERRHPRAMPTSRWTDEVSSLPVGRWMIRQIRRHGSKRQRGRLKRILARSAAGMAGQPRKALGDHKDVAVAMMLEECERRLKSGFDYVRDQRKAAGYQGDGELISAALVTQGYQPKEKKVLLDFPTLRSAAANLIAGEDRKVKSVLTMAARGRRKLARLHAR